MQLRIGVFRAQLMLTESALVPGDQLHGIVTPELRQV